MLCSTKARGRASIQTKESTTKEAAPFAGGLLLCCSALLQEAKAKAQQRRAAALRCLPAPCGLCSLRAAPSLPLFAASFTLCGAFGPAVIPLPSAGLLASYRAISAALSACSHTGRPLRALPAALPLPPKEEGGAFSACSALPAY